MPRCRTFRRVLLSSLVDDGEWPPAEREDGSRSFTTFSEGAAAVLVEYREDFAAELAHAMERQDR